MSDHAPSTTEPALSPGPQRAERSLPGLHVETRHTHESVESCRLPECLSDLTRVTCADLFRYKGACGLRGFLRVYLRRVGFRVSFWGRVTAYLRQKRLLRPLYWFAAVQRTRCAIRYGIDIPPETLIGPGLYIGHFGAIVVNGEARLGRNCNLSHGVTIGKIKRGPHAGVPTIGDNVYIAPGAKVLGGVRVGSNAAIGANAVVVRDVQDNEVVGGVPARVLSNKGSKGYVNWTDYE